MTLAITSFNERVNHYYAQLQRVGAIRPNRQEITSMFGREFFQEVAEIAWKSLNIGSCSCFCFYDVQVCLGMFFSSEKQSSKPSRSGSKLDVMSQSCKKYDKGDNHSIRVFVKIPETTDWWLVVSWPRVPSGAPAVTSCHPPQSHKPDPEGKCRTAELEEAWSFGALVYIISKSLAEKGFLLPSQKKNRRNL